MADEVIIDEPETVLDEKLETLIETPILIEQAEEVISEPVEVIKTEEIIPEETIIIETISDNISKENNLAETVNSDKSEKEEHIDTNSTDIEFTTEIEDTDISLDDTTEMTTEELEKGPSGQSRATNELLLRSTTARNTRLASSGTYHFTSSVGIKAEPKINSANLATYSAGQSIMTVSWIAMDTVGSATSHFQDCVAMWLFRNSVPPLL